MLPSPLQLVCALFILGFVFCCAYARVRLPLATHPQSPGRAYRLLHAYHYLRPAERMCPGCGFANAATSLRCENPVDHSSATDELSAPGEFFTRERTRQWGLRILIGLIVLAAVASGRSFALYVPIAATLLWLVIPMIVCQRESGAVFAFLAVLIFIATAVARFAARPLAHAQSKAVGSIHLSTAPLHLSHVSLGANTVTQGAVWLNALCAIAALGSVLLSVAGHRQNAEDDVYGPVKALSLGVALSGLLLAAISALQQLNGLALLYLAVGVAALAWLLGAFVLDAVLQSVGSVKSLPRAYLVARRMRLPHRPGALARPSRRDLSEQLAYVVERILISTAHTSRVVATQCLNLLAHLAEVVANSLIRSLHWIALYIQAVAIAFVRNLRDSFPVLFRLATAGYRVAMFGPALLVGAGLLASVSAEQAHLYLAVGGAAHMVWSVLSLALAALSVSVAAALFVQWSVVRSFLAAVQEEYIAQAIIFFALFLDAYGLERLLVHQSSHFGVVSWLLNALLLVISAPGFRRRHARASSAPAP